jgi:hypothetical protein
MHRKKHKIALTPLSLALWIMCDGSGMRDGGFKLSSRFFDIVSNV